MLDLNADAAVDQLTTIRDWLRWTTSRFFEAEVALGHGSDTYWDESVFLVLQALYLPPTADNRVVNAKLTFPERQRVVDWVRRRIHKREPLPYIAQTAWQQGLGFYVDPRVLIPRSPIAQLIADGISPWFDESQEPERILDMCTGSGCLAILAAYAFPDAKVDAVDISEDALQVAAINVQKLEVESRVRLIQSDGFTALSEDTKYDLIISNPPYVDLNDMDNLAPEFLHEPRLALESGDNGLEFTEAFLASVANYLNPEGFLVLEVGNSWKALEAAYPGFSFMWLELEDAVGVTVMTHAECLELAQLISNTKN